MTKTTIPPAFFVFDAESIGLHGEHFAVAGGVYLPNGAAQWEFRYACSAEYCRGDESDREWVNENVPMIDATHRGGLSMRDAFWEQWMKAKAQYPGIAMAAECAWPVEAGLVARCIADDPDRKWQGPYPFHEIASFMAAAGMDPMANYDRMPSEMPKHDPLADARQSARLLAEAIAKLEGIK